MRIPPPARPELDALSRAGALRLRAVILKYWRDRGCDSAQCTIEEIDGSHVVRGNLIRGLPPGPCIVLEDAPRRGRAIAGAAPRWLSYLGSSLARLA